MTDAQPRDYWPELTEATDAYAQARNAHELAASQAKDGRSTQAEVDALAGLRAEAWGRLAGETVDAGEAVRVGLVCLAHSNPNAFLNLMEMAFGQEIRKQRLELDGLKATLELVRKGMQQFWYDVKDAQAEVDRLKEPPKPEPRQSW